MSVPLGQLPENETAKNPKIMDNDMNHSHVLWPFRLLELIISILDLLCPTALENYTSSLRTPLIPFHIFQFGHGDPHRCDDQEHGDSEGNQQ